MPRALKVLAIHGIGHQEAKKGEWVDQWTQTIARGLKSAAADSGAEEVTLEIDFFDYDRTFEKSAYPLSGRAYLTALRELGTAMMFRDMSLSAPGTRGVFDNFTQGIRWSVGMVAQWVAYRKLRQELNAALLKKIQATKPDVILAHSLGTLISYDALSQSSNGTDTTQTTLLTLGSQIGHSAVLGSVFGGRVRMPPVERWYHLFNPEDNVFTAEIRLSDLKFRQVETYFDVPFETTNHSAVEYLRHANTRRAWESIVTDGTSEDAHRMIRGLFKQERKDGAMYRALIVGIDEYANPQANLDGCANDAYLMSATLQELGFPAEQIRLVLNDRATSVTLRERLEWLLEDVQPGDVRFLHYSGHGAQIPSYGPNAEIDQFDECLVPHDFDWTPGRAILDDWFYEQYSQLPYDARFIAVLDCCHSGGMTRAGGIRVRGLNPPDDIRHRAMQFDPVAGWHPRELTPFDTAVSSRKTLERQLTGLKGTTHRLGGALSLRRRQTAAEYRKSQETYGHYGPYLPVLMHACAEVELAEEIRVGATAHGAFTYHVTNALRKLRQSGRQFSYNALIAETTATMARAGVTQKPQLVGPTLVLNKPVPPNDQPAKQKSKAKPVSKKSPKRKPKAARKNVTLIRA